MPTTQSLVGLQFGSWNVVADAQPCWDHWKNKAARRDRSLCRCVCGVERIVRNHNLTYGKTQSCGCQREAWNRTHGMAGTRQFSQWRRMIQRCHNFSHPQYQWYGARGITVCERWRSSFTAFFSDMGMCPPGLTIERVDNFGMYEPGNCVWADKTTQARNRRNNRMVTFGGVTACLSEICERFHLPYKIVSHRLLRGWSDEYACSKPVRAFKTRPWLLPSELS